MLLFLLLLRGACPKVDMLAFAVDHPAPATIILIAGDRDYAHAVSTLKLRKYRVILVVPPSSHTSSSLESQASLVIDWSAAVLRSRTEAVNSTQAVRQPCPELDANLIAKLVRELHGPTPESPKKSVSSGNNIAPGGQPIPETPSRSRGTSVSAQKSTPPPESPKKSVSSGNHTTPGGQPIPKTPSRSRGTSVSPQEFTPTPEPPKKSVSSGNGIAPGGQPIPKTPSHSRGTSVSAQKSPPTPESPKKSVSSGDHTEPGGQPIPKTPSHSRGTSVSVQKSTPTPESPKKSVSSGNNIAPGGQPIPKTPSRSPVTSVSTGSTRAYSTTIVAQSSPAATEQDISARSPTSPGTRRSSPPDLTDVVGPAKCSPSVLPSLDTLELPLREGCPPSATIVRSGLESSQSGPVSGQLVASSSHKFNSLASPFVMAKAPTALEPTYPKWSYTTAAPPSPITTATKRLSETATSICETPRVKNFGVSKEIEWPTCLGTVRLRLTNSISPSPPAAISPRFSNGVNSQFAAFSRVPNNLGHSAVSFGSLPFPSASPSTSFTTTEPHDHDGFDRRTWTVFKPLIHLLLAARERGIARPLRSTIALDLVQSDKQVYERAGVSRFRQYTTLAEQAGIIQCGGVENDAWMPSPRITHLGLLVHIRVKSVLHALVI